MKTRLFLFVGLVSAAVYALIAAEPNGGDKDKSFVAHEWGTFTSVQGADGKQMTWDPFVAPELPKFVYDSMFGTAGQRQKLPAIIFAGKSGLFAVQRMETPVIYFYSDRARTLDVSVRFPQGQVTEWYPRQSPVLPVATPAENPAERLALHWPRVEVLPKAESANVVLPMDPSGSHYYAARETDAAVLRVPSGEQTTEVEKFLFYRGIATFQAPLIVKPDAKDSKRLTLTNTGSEELRHLFVYEVRDGGGAWLSLDKLNPGETREVSLEPGPGVHPLTPEDTSLDKAMKVNSLRLNASLDRALTHEGLYPREAEAMVKTWESSWFAEKGVRVLYILPRTWTDRTLPLAIEPKPHAIERVMVARAEVITPEMEQKLVIQVEHYLAAVTASDEAAQAKVVTETRALGFGRFIQPAMGRMLIANPRDQAFRDAAMRLVYSISFQSGTSPKATAAR